MTWANKEGRTKESQERRKRRKQGRKEVLDSFGFQICREGNKAEFNRILFFEIPPIPKPQAAVVILMAEFS